MDRNKAAAMARALMNQHGLHHVPFEFDRATKRLGACHSLVNRYSGVSLVKKITLSQHYVDILPEEEVRNTILHEIAHALAGAHNGHNQNWKRVAVAVGAKPERCARPSAVPETSVKGICPKGHEFPAHRLPQRVKFCPRCTGPYRGRMLEWHKNGKPVVISQMPTKYQNEELTLTLKGYLG